MLFHKQLKSLVFAVATLAGSAANAAIISEWSVGVDAVFLPGSVVANDGSADGIAVSNNDKTLRWGSDNGGPSGLDINNGPGSTVVNTGVGVSLPPVTNFSLTHINQKINKGAASLGQVLLSVSLTLTPMNPLLAPVSIGTIDFMIDFLESKNRSDICANGEANGTGVNLNGCGDIFVIADTSLNFEFMADSDGEGGDDPLKYYFSFVGMENGLNPLSEAACLSATGSSAACYGFVTPEGRNTNLSFGAMITTEKVAIAPDPDPDPNGGSDPDPDPNGGNDPDPDPNGGNDPNPVPDDPNAVPAPGVLGLMGVALAVMGGVLRRRRHT